MGKINQPSVAHRHGRCLIEPKATVVTTVFYLTYDYSFAYVADLHCKGTHENRVARLQAELAADSTGTIADSLCMKCICGWQSRNLKAFDGIDAFFRDR
jgi:hypothetical protein